MKIISQQHLRLITRRFWGIFFSAIIALAVVIQIGRQAFPLINDYRGVIVESLGKQLGVVVTVERVQAKWLGLRPSVVLEKLAVSSKSGVEAFNVRSAKAELSILDSIIQRGLAWRTISFEEFSANISQKEDKSWGIDGIGSGTANAENPFIFDDPFDIFLFGRRVDIRSAKLNFIFLDGSSTELVVPLISLENDRFFHRMTAGLEHDGEKLLSLVIEGYGDPRHKKNFSASGYLQLRQIPTTDIYNALVDKTESGAEERSESLADVEPRAFDDVDALSDNVKNTLDLQLWFTGSSASGMTASGYIDVQGLPQALQEQVVLPERLTADLAGAWHERTGWYLNIQKPSVTWAEQQVDLSTVGFYGKGFNPGVRMQTLELDGLVKSLLLANAEKNNGVVKAIRALQPEGRLHNLDVRLTDANHGYFNARAFIEKGGSGAYMGSPELRNINGYAESSLFSGYADVTTKDRFVLYLSKVFDDAFLLDEVDGQVAWRVDLHERRAYLNSSYIVGRQQDKSVYGGFALDLPFSRKVGEQKLALLIAADQALAKDYHYYIPRNAPKSLKGWLKDAQLSGNVKDIQVLYHGSVDKRSTYRPLYQVSAAVENASMIFDSHWPKVTDLDAKIFIDSDSFMAQVDHAQLAGNTVDIAQVQSLTPTEGQSRRIDIEGQVQGSAGAAKQLLLQSPIRTVVGSFLPGWTLSGEYSAALEFHIPLNFDLDALEYEVAAQLQNIDLSIDALTLDIHNIIGELRYSDDQMMSGIGLTADVWDNTFNFGIHSDLASQSINFDFEGSANSDRLMQWTRQPILHFVKQDFLLKGGLRVPILRDESEPILSLHIESDLKETLIDLPAPLGKVRGQSGDYSLDINYYEYQSIYEFNIDKKAHIQSRLSEGNPPGLRVSIGQPLTEDIFLESGKINIKGYLPQANYKEWKSVLDKYLLVQQAFSDVEDDNDFLLKTQADLLIDHFNFEDIPLAGLTLKVDGDEDQWRFYGESAMFDGEIVLPNDGSRVKLNFNRLSLPSSDSSSQVDSPDEESAFANLDISDIDPLQVTINHLQVGAEDWGRWQFIVDPIENGLSFPELNANFRNLKIGNGEPAKFVWMKEGDAHSSHFVGKIFADNIGDTLETWGQERLLDSQRAVFDIDASWPAPPDQVSLVGLNGDIQLDIANGSFIRGAEAGENPLLRLIALFNFDTLARRLRLDFSDLAAKGFAYDRIYSEVNFDDGTATLLEPLVVESSSSKMQMAGTIDLMDEEVDAELVVTLPVAGNLIVATAFVAGLPAGLGVYLVSKMFGEQVDKVSSISYRVRGSWNDPKIRVRKIFDDTAARKKGDALKNEESPKSVEESDK